ncbi:MAG: hypothetical protein WB729_24900 [Candidatus Sulfotelmatobacter sp.]
MRSSYEVVADIVRSNPTLEFLSLVSYEENVNWRDLPRESHGLALPLLREGLKQGRGARIINTLPRRGILEGSLAEMAKNLGESRLLGLCSNVQLANGRSAHIPMMDFLCAPTKENLNLLANLIGDLRQGRGYLLQSGRSYHYYGFRLLTEAEWKVFLGKCLLMSGFADDRYIGHQLVDGYCALRLSSGNLKKSVPMVVAEIPLARSV